MQRLCIVDIDGTVANRDARLALARGVYVAKCKEEGKEPEPQIYNHGFDWNTFQDPENLYLDTLIPGTNDALNTLIDQGYTLVFLSSRPESMRADTIEWFALYVFIRQSCEIILKAEEDRYQKTPDWKAVQVQHLVDQYQPYEVLFVDDRAENVNALMATWHNPGIPLQMVGSLADAIK